MAGTLDFKIHVSEKNCLAWRKTLSQPVGHILGFFAVLVDDKPNNNLYVVPVLIFVLKEDNTIVDYGNKSTVPR